MVNMIVDERDIIIWGNMMNNCIKQENKYPIYLNCQAGSGTAVIAINPDISKVEHNKILFLAQWLTQTAFTFSWHYLKHMASKVMMKGKDITWVVFKVGIGHSFQLTSSTYYWAEFSHIYLHLNTGNNPIVITLSVAYSIIHIS